MRKLPPVILADDFVEHYKIGWRVEPGVPDPHNPLLEPKFPWDSAGVGCGHGTVLKDPIDGKFKAWVTSLAQAPDNEVTATSWQSYFRLTYLESDDGAEWRRPELDLCPFPGHPRTNILQDYDSGGTTTYASVFIDPEENPEEPYEMFCFRNPGFHCPTMTVAGLNQKPRKSRQEVYGPGGTYGLYRYRSKDGLHWRAVEGPIGLKSGDTCHIHRDKKIGYVAHHKDCLPMPAGGFAPYDIAAQQGVRVNFRRTSSDGTHWTERQYLMSADWRDHQADQIMELGRHPYREGFIGLAAIYNAMNQTMNLQFAASLDSAKWWRPLPRKPCLDNGPLGDYGSGMIWPTRTLIEHEGRLYTYYGALDGLHGDIYSGEATALHFHGAWCRASWKIGRFWAAVPAEGGMSPGYLTTGMADAKGKKLFINATTGSGGKVEVELLDESRKPIPGFARKDCHPFGGDDEQTGMAWEGHSASPRNGVHVRFWLTKARLYGYEWR